MEDHDDFAFEPVRGLPERLPEGERMLWQGAPEWWPLARQAFHVVKVAAYFCVLITWDMATSLRTGMQPAEALQAAWSIGLAGLATIGILCGLAALYARSTVYTLTTKRVVIRSGLALPVTLNLPLSLIETASVTRRGDHGGIALKVVKPNRIALLALWPNARPWAFSDPQPMLRAIADVDTVAPLLARALEASAGVASVTQPQTMAARPRDHAIGDAASAAA